MSKPPATPTPTVKPPMSRFAIVLSGVALGAAWGSIMWLIFELTGSETGVRGWAYLAISIGMLGGGVAAFFGATGARKSGERLGPRLWGRRGRDR